MRIAYSGVIQGGGAHGMSPHPLISGTEVPLGLPLQLYTLSAKNVSRQHLVMPLSLNAMPR